MGRSYLFECSRCGYRAKVAGRADRGLDFYVQTVMCRDCKQLYDVVTRLRFADEPQRDTLSLRRLGLWNHPRLLRHAPRFEAVLNRLPSRPLRNFRWLQFSPQCPASPAHRIQVWNAPDKCPRCATVLEKNVLPYRIWE